MNPKRSKPYTSTRLALIATIGDDPHVAAASPAGAGDVDLRFRQIHLDFHTSPLILHCTPACTVEATREGATAA